MDLRKLTASVLAAMTFAACTFSCGKIEESDGNKASSNADISSSKSDESESKTSNDEERDVVQLSDIESATLNGLVLKDDVVTDVEKRNYPGGNTYMAKYSEGFLDANSGNVSGEFNIDKKYKCFVATLVPDVDFKDGKSTAFELYGDEELICSYTIKKDTEAFKIKEDISNVKYLKIVMYSLDQSGDVQDSNVIIYNPLLYKTYDEEISETDTEAAETETTEAETTTTVTTTETTEAATTAETTTKPQETVPAEQTVNTQAIRLEDGILTVDNKLFGMSLKDTESYLGTSLGEPEDFPWWSVHLTLYYYDCDGEKYNIFFNDNDKLAIVQLDQKGDFNNTILEKAKEKFGEPDFESDIYTFNIGSRIYLNMYEEVYTTTNEWYFRQQCLSSVYFN